MPAPTLLFLMKLKNDLTWERLKCRAPAHPSTPQISGTSGRGPQAGLKSTSGLSGFCVPVVQRVCPQPWTVQVTAGPALSVSTLT